MKVIYIIIFTVTILGLNHSYSEGNAICEAYIAFDSIGIIHPNLEFSPDNAISMYLVNTAGTPNITQISITTDDTFADWSSDGLEIAYKSTGMTPNVFIYNVLSDTTTQFLEGNDIFIYNFEWSPDNEKIAYVGTYEIFNTLTDLFIFDIDTQTVENVTSNLEADAHLIKWHPNSSIIALQTRIQNDNSIYIINIEDNSIIEILANSFSTQWYEDGRILRFAKEQDDVVSFYAYDMQTGEIQNLGEEARGIRSFDNQYTAYYQDNLIYTQNLNTGEVEILQSGLSENYATRFVWSPYSAEIAFFEPEVDEIETRDGGYIYIKNLETGEVRNALGEYILYRAPLGALGWSPCIEEPES